MDISQETLSDISTLRNFTQVYQNSTPIVHVGDVPLLMHELAYAGFADTYRLRRKVVEMLIIRAFE
jgi:hypothetical protein